jgi:small subunit ribosomal protein S7
MSRRHSAVKREILPDPKYKDLLVSKFINNLMEEGKKAIARNIVYSAFEIVEKKLGGDAIEIFKECVEAVEPQLEVKSRRVGGATYQVPIDVAPRRARTLAIRWILDAVKKRNEKTAVARLATEIMDIKAGRGAALKSRDSSHKMAEANRAFAHYRW